MNDIEAIIKELAIEALETNRKSRFRKIFKTYEELQANAIFQIFTSAEDIFVNQSDDNKLVLSSSKKLSTKKKKQLRKEIKNELAQKGRSHLNFMKNIIEVQGPKSILNFRNRTFLKKHSKRVKKRLKA